MLPRKVVLDTNVLVAGLRSKRGASFKILSLLGQGRFEFCISVSLILEYEEVLKTKADPQLLSSEDIEDFVDYLCKTGKRFNIYYLWRPTLRDPDDEMVLEIAVASKSDYIVTFNTRDFVKANFFGVKVVTPNQFLKLIGGTNP